MQVQKGLSKLLTNKRKRIMILAITEGHLFIVRTNFVVIEHTIEYQQDTLVHT